MASSNPLSVTPPRRYQRTGDLLVEDVQKDDEWLYSPSTEPSPVLLSWDDEGAPLNIRMSFERNAGAQSQLDRSNSLRGKLGLEPRSSSRSSSQSVTPHEVSPTLRSRGPSQGDFAAGMAQRLSEARFQDRSPLDEASPKQSLFELRSMFRDDQRAKQDEQEITRRMSAPSPIALRRVSSNIPTPPGHAPPSSVTERITSRESASPSIIERSVSAGSKIPFAPGARRINSPSPTPPSAPSPSPTPPKPSPRRASDGGSHLADYRPATPDEQRPGYAAMQARVKAGFIRFSPSPARESPPPPSAGPAKTPPSSVPHRMSDGARTPPSSVPHRMSDSGARTPPSSVPHRMSDGGARTPPSPVPHRMSDGASPRPAVSATLRRASSSPGQNVARLSGPGQSGGAIPSPATPGSASRMSSAGSFSGRATPASSSGNVYMTPASGTPSKAAYLSPNRTGNRSVNQPAKPAYTASSTRSMSMGSSSKAGFNSSVPRTFTFLEDPTPKRRGSALEREEMASLTQETSPAAPAYLFPDEESPRRPVADTNDQSWAHVRSAVAQAKRSRSMGGAGSPRDVNGASKTVGRGDSSSRTSSVRSSAERGTNPRTGGGLLQPGQSASYNGGDSQLGAAGLLAGKRSGSSGNLAAAEHSPSFTNPTSVNRASYYPPGIPPPGGIFQPEAVLTRGKDPEKMPGVVSSDDESWGPGEGSKDGSVSGESGPLTGSLASEDDEEVGGKQPGKGAAKPGAKKRRRFRKARSRFRGTESGVEGDESEIDVDTASLATAGSPLPGSLHVALQADNQSLPDTASDTMSIEAAEGGGVEGRGSDRLLTRAGRREGVEVLEPLPDVSIDAEEGVLALRPEQGVAGGAKGSAGEPGEVGGDSSEAKGNQGEARRDQREAEEEPRGLAAAVASAVAVAAAAVASVTGFGAAIDTRDEQSQTEDVLSEKEPASSRGEWRTEEYAHKEAERKAEETKEVVVPAPPQAEVVDMEEKHSEGPGVVTDHPVVTNHPVETDHPVETGHHMETDYPMETDQPMETDHPVVTGHPSVTDHPVVTDHPMETYHPVVTDHPIATDHPVATDHPILTDHPVAAAPVVAEAAPQATPIQESVPASKPPLNFEEMPIVAKGSFAAAMEGPVVGPQFPSTAAPARTDASELPTTGPSVSAPVQPTEPLQESPSEILMEETAVQTVGMSREGPLPDEQPAKAHANTEAKPVEPEITEAALENPASRDAPEAAGDATGPKQITPPKPKPPVLSFDDIPVRGIQGIFGERPPVHSPPSQNLSPASFSEKRDSAAPRPSASAQDGTPKQGPKGEGARRIRSAGGSASAAMGLRAGSSGANLEKAIASMNRRNTMRRSSDRSTATGASENYEWERSSLADETYSDISTPSTMLSRKTLEEAAESAIFCSSIVHDLVYQAASLAQEKEDLAKLGKASGELVKLVSKQRGPEMDRFPAAARAGTSSRRGNGGTASSLQTDKESEDPPKGKKQPACGCTIL